MSSNFDWKFFIYLNPNLIDLEIDTEIKCLAYWYNIDNCQSITNHIDKDSFNWKKYLEANPDLSKLGINNERDSLIHWYKFGKYENRLINPNKDLLTLDKDKKNIIDKQQSNISNLEKNKLMDNFISISSNYIIKLSESYQKNIELNLSCINSSNKYNLIDQNNLNCVSKGENTNSKLSEENIELFDNNIGDNLSNNQSLISNDEMTNQSNLYNSPKIHNKFNNLNLNDLTNNLKYDNSKVLINILTRTSRRKNYFTECRKSVLEQTYSNIRHIISVDDNESYKYVKLNGCEEFNIVRNQRQIRHSENHMPYNLYINSLLNKVNSGWIMILDDDDILINNLAIQNIVNNLPDFPSILIFKTQYGNGFKPETHFKKGIVKGDVTSNCFIFHSSLKQHSYWNDQKGSDYFFLNKLSQKSDIFWINQVFTKVNNQYLMGRGNRIDKNLLNNKLDILLLKNIFLSSKNIYFQKNFTKTCFLNKYFDHIYILNLDRRIDKFVKTINRLTNYDITYFERFIGIDGSLPNNRKKFEEYLLSLNNNNSFNKKTIPSAGSYFILQSMKLLLEDAIKKKYSRILVFQDDIIIHKNFNQLIIQYDNLLMSNWDLIYFGASQHIWKKIIFSSNYYNANNTEGAFALGIDRKIFVKLIDLISKTNSPFDSGPLISIQNSSPQKCYVMYPNLIISDVTDSDCRIARDQLLISEKFRWENKNYDFDFYLKKDIIKLKLNNNIYTPLNSLKEINDLVTVIISVYNCEMILENSIKSICNQSYTNLEILIIDDNSCDNTFNILKNLSSKDKRIKFYKNKRRKGEFVNRNFAIKNSTGKFITFHNPDQYSFNKRIEYQLTFLKNNCQFEGCTISTNSLSKCNLKCLKSSLLIRKRVINKIGYFDSVYYGADKEYIERLLISNLRIYCISKYLITKLNRLDNIQFNKNIKILKKIYKFSYQIYFEKLRKKKYILSSDIYVNYPMNNRLYKIVYTTSNQKNQLEVN